MELLPVLVLIMGCSWLLWQRYLPGLADRLALRTLRIKTRRMADIAPAALQPTYSDMARRVQRVVPRVPANQRHQVRLALEDIYNDLLRVLLADTTPDPIIDYTHNRLAGIDRRLRDTEVLVLRADE